MADNPKLEMSDSCGSESKTGTQKISVLDHVNGFQYESTDKSDSFVIDMESLCHGTNKDSTPNSRITLQRNLSRKGSMRSSEKKKNSNFNTNKCSKERDTTIAALSPKGSSMPERTPTAMAVGATDDHSNNQQVHHQITITTAESRFPLRRNSFKRSTPSWILDPKRVKHGNNFADILYTFDKQDQYRRQCGLAAVIGDHRTYWNRNLYKLCHH